MSYKSICLSKKVEGMRIYTLSNSCLSLLFYLVFFASSSYFSACEAAVYPYAPSKKIIGNMQYIVAGKDPVALSTIARQYQIGYDALVLANPHITNNKQPAQGTIIYLPHAVIVPKIQPNEVVVNIAEKRLFYLHGDSMQLYVWPVGIGRTQSQTPLGSMHVIAMRKNPTWYVPKDALREAHAIGFFDHPVRVDPGPENPLGKYAISLSKRSYLIHSTHDPTMVGTRNTSGCMNMYPEDSQQLYRMLKVSDKVHIVNMPVKSIMEDGVLHIETHPNLDDYIEDIATKELDAIRARYFEQIAEEALAENFKGNNHSSVDNLLTLIENPFGVPTHFQL